MSIDTFLLSSDTTDLNYPEVRPTLDLNFARVKALDPRITFTRASGGSYVGADGLIKLAGVNEPRFDHDPVTGESLGLLVEEARTNSFLYSEQLDNAAWRKFDITATANAGLAPDGTTTAELITTASTTAQKYFDQFPQPVLQTSSNYCVSFFVKLISGTGNATSVSISSANGAISPVYASYALRLDNFAESTEGNLPSVRGYTIFPNGWVRMYMVFNTSTQTNADIQFRFGTNDTVSSYHVWGLQYEQGSFPTSYIPTEASTRTRAADVASITGKNFSSWYNQSEGSIMMNAKIQEVQNGTTKQIFIFEGNTSTQRILDVYTFSSNVTYRNFYVDNNGVNDISVSNFTANVFQKFARSYGENSMSAVTTGIVNGTTSTTIPTTIQQLGIFAGISYGTGFGTANGTIGRFTYYPKRLTNAQLQVLTR